MAEDPVVLRAALARSAEIEDLTEAMLEVASIIQEALAPLGFEAVVVGGLAVACWVPTEYLTGDIDLVMPTHPEIDARLAELGLAREGRFWTLPDSDLFIEAPEATLRPNRDGFEPVALPSGRSVLVQSPEDVLVVRMLELEGTPHSEVFEQCLLLLGSGEVSTDVITQSAEAAGLSPILEWLWQQVEVVRAGGTLPESWQIGESDRLAPHALTGEDRDTLRTCGHSAATEHRSRHGPTASVRRCPALPYVTDPATTNRHAFSANDEQRTT